MNSMRGGSGLLVHGYCDLKGPFFVMVVTLPPGKGPFNHPTDAHGNELSVSAASNCLDGDAECLTGLGQPLAAVAEVAKGWTLQLVGGF
jgi:hypothetical protein